MTEVRVVVQFTAENAGIADKQVQALAERSGSVQKEPGCLQFEVFRSVSRPEKYALIELWESQEVLDERARARGGGPPPLAEGVTRVIEHYQHQRH
jgi:quinol monooxygenase YgiN